jgi:acetyl-CoA carboxylase beta subunit
VEKDEMYSKCPSCHAETNKFAAEVYVCKNPDCQHVDARQLITMLEDVGLNETVIGEVRANLVLKMF